MASTKNTSSKKRAGSTSSAPKTIQCMCCGETLSANEFYKSKSIIHKSIGKIPYCKGCLDEIYHGNLQEYEKLNYPNPDKMAMERICMMLDLYYSDDVFDSAVKSSKTEKRLSGVPMVSLYLKQSNLRQHSAKNYNTTVEERYNDEKCNYGIGMVPPYTEQDFEDDEDADAAKALFGAGFEHDDYLYLYDQYQDWTARHECNTKAQEEVFKNICMTQLQLRKAMLGSGDTDKLSKQLQQWLDTGKLQPKQNIGDTTAQNQTLGTLIEKWENTRPIPEIEEELRDVDKIGLYIDVFFRGHTAKSLGKKGAMSNLYEKFIERFTVRKPEYSEDEDDEYLVDTVLGSASLEDDVSDSEGVV